MWKNIVELDRPQMTIRRIRIACWIRKSTHTHTHTQTHTLSENVLLFHGNSGYANAPHYYVYTYLICLVSSCLEVEVSYFDFITKFSTLNIS